MDIKEQLEELKATIEENATDEQKAQIKEIEKQQKYEKFLHDLHDSVGTLKQLERRIPIRFSEKVWKQRRKHTAEVKASRRRNRG